MPIDRPDRNWDVDLLKQQLGKMNNENAGLKKEILRLENELGNAGKAGENAWRQVSELRRLVQDSHLRTSHLQSRNRDLFETTWGGALERTPKEDQSQTHATGQTENLNSDARVAPSIIEHVPDKEDSSEYWPTPDSALPALAVHPGWGNYTRKGREGVVLGLSLLGLDDTGRARVIELVVQQQLRHRDLFPVFITDDDDFRPLRNEHFVFEYLPPWPGSEVEPSRARWDEFLVDRLALIRLKWGIRRFVSFAGPDDIVGIGQTDIGGIGKHLSELLEEDPD